MDVLAALEGSTVAAFLRGSWWAYPLVNTAHVFGLAALFGSILVLDLRTLGLWPRIDRDALAGPAVAVAAVGLLVAAASGVLLFAVRAGEYAALPVFWVKLALVAFGTANALAGRFAGLDRRAPRTVPAVSLASWAGAMLAGRLIGYASF